MIGTAQLRQNGLRRLALLLVACSLLLRILVPAGWMPQAGAAGVTLSWCDDSGLGGFAGLSEAKALLADAIGEKPAPAHKLTDQPCSFAAAAQPLAAFDVAALPLAPAPPAEAVRARFVVEPGHGLAAPPPRSTGPPLLA